MKEGPNARSRALPRLVLAGVWGALVSTGSIRPAAAQLGADTGTGNNLDIEHFYPAMLGLGALDRSRAQGWGEWSVGLYVHYARNPLVLFADRLQIGEVVGHRVSTDLVGTLGLLSWLDVTVAVPVTWYQTGDAALPTGDLASIGFRDLRIAPKLSLRQDVTGFLGLAFVPELSIPTGGSESFFGSGNLTFSPHLIADRTFDLLWGFRIGLAAGVRIRPRTEIGNIEIDDEIFYRVGGGVGLPSFFSAAPEAIAELTGVTRLDSVFDRREQNGLIGRLGLRMTWEPTPGHQFIGTGGFALGATRGYGAPDFQIYLGAVYRRYLTDRDKDGIYDDDDACPDDPEDKDGFEDLDGCPDPDNDRDGIPDVSDQCPDDAEDKDGFEDLDGCPDPDNDRDGIPDVVDECDNDPEDFDGFEDEDGCPEPDNDRDGIPDALDKCPDAKETINGVDDEDGCPDEGDPHVEVTSEKVTIDTRINFDFDSDRIRSDSFSILDQVALTLKANLQLRRVRVEGHTDERGRADYNRDLSQRRAESVMRYLVAKGVDTDRLEAVGYGEDFPLVPGNNEAAWAKNRRVEFTILAQGEVPQRGNRDIRLPVEQKN